MSESEGSFKPSSTHVGISHISQEVLTAHLLLVNGSELAGHMRIVIVIVSLSLKTRGQEPFKLGHHVGAIKSMKHMSLCLLLWRTNTDVMLLGARTTTTIVHLVFNNWKFDFFFFVMLEFDSTSVGITKLLRSVSS